MRDLSEEIDRIARTDARVLITGESGVGKELVATAVHARSQRASRPFVAVNCAGIPESLLESELFGHVRGSFTGAYRDKAGKLEQANHGVIFLDEVGEMTLRMQGLLLRFLGTGELQKVGADRMGAQLNVRVVAATNRKLQEMVLQGHFREDLYYRLNVVHIAVPALRDRRDDIPALISHFLRRFTAAHDSVVREISPDAFALLTQYSWPGNVRQLENVMERVVVTCRNPVITEADLPTELHAAQFTGVRKERRRLPIDDLYDVMRQGESFWTVVYARYMQRELTREDVRHIIRRGLQESRGSYRIVSQLFNMKPDDYKRFLNFLRKHNCQIAFQDYRR